MYEVSTDGSGLSIRCLKSCFDRVRNHPVGDLVEVIFVGQKLLARLSGEELGAIHPGKAVLRGGSLNGREEPLPLFRRVAGPGGGADSRIPEKDNLKVFEPREYSECLQVVPGRLPPARRMRRGPEFGAPALGRSCWLPCLQCPGRG